ncbi:hypothetical protein MN202_20450 [Rheinheimera muenzenbergensis]|uniref:Rap1a immunity protein domain-containing protein n=1 Tax=Rheinheimera muenzenbergensis TaxID=1193628 RepID=A0ABU8CCR0_9GAMM
MRIFFTLLLFVATCQATSPIDLKTFVDDCDQEQTTKIGETPTLCEAYLYGFLDSLRLADNEIHKCVVQIAPQDALNILRNEVKSGSDIVHRDFSSAIYIIIIKHCGD